MGIMVYSLLWVMQDLYHQQYVLNLPSVSQCPFEHVQTYQIVQIDIHRAGKYTPTLDAIVVCVVVVLGGRGSGIALNAPCLALA